MRLITHADWQVMPWKNGGGQTTQLAISPAGAGFDTFAWRLSMASARENGPFSRFEGIDRTLLILEGPGVILHRPSQPAVSLNPSSAPFVFSGEESVTMTLVDGPILDFNVMTRRALCQHTVAIRQAEAPLTVSAENALRVLFCRHGSATVGDTLLQPRAAILLNPGETLPPLIPDAPLELLDIRIIPADGVSLTAR